MAREGLQHHIHLADVDSAPYALLPNDPAHSKIVASHLDRPQLVAQNREFETWRGFVDDTPVVVTSTGVGGPSTALAIEELAKTGVHTFIRLGTSLTMQPYVRTGDLAIATAAVRDEGTSRNYMPPEFPAAGDFDVLTALREGADTVGARRHLGIVHSKDAFYGETEPERLPMATELRARLDLWARAGAICSEMETAATYVVSSALGVRAGSVIMMWGDDVDGANPPPLDGLHRTGVEAVRALISRER
ncbi:nucleoside phosphorylase [Corynebacterium sp. AOP40-9SA-29]|uniref:nucleoside phosphorylase n=1 Tax=Corynebacterium sp. AOP40-9SA-29 TaxID=3457677 RepID=UPI004033E716